ncbi:conjugal transfer protein MobA [Pedobacter sp. KLB.chiD]|uniref:conjugal transfer protein MobA n=1 Tax=Pedobacter sp. KLB.chiD TaxID=3387402 RepID=UPI00399BF6EC
MKHDKKEQINKGGRKRKIDPAIYRYSISFNAQEHARFLSLFENSGMKVKARFIIACIFSQPLKTIRIDKGTIDFYMRLTSFHSQFRSVGVNYNQIVKLLYRNFSDKKAAAYLFKLEKETAELAHLCKKVLEIVEEFETKYITNNDAQ